MTAKKWSEDDTKFLKANLGRMDALSLAHQLDHPLAEVEKRLKQIRHAQAEAAAAQRKAPATLKEAAREASLARKEYEKAIELFHKRKLDDAAKRFEALLEEHPDEKEFADRARMYLAACRNGKKARAGSPSEPEELYHAAVFEKNRGNVEKALDLLKKTSGRKDGDGRLHYLAACCHALVGDAEQALTNLKKAIAADDQNRIQARLEADLVSLRGTPAFSELVAGA